MRALTVFFTIGLAIWTSNAGAQGNNNPPVINPPPVTVSGGSSSMWGWDIAGTTPGGSYLQGLGSVIRAQGDYNLATSAAAVNYTTAVRQGIQNQKDYVEAYFAIREYNRQYREAEYARDRQLTQEWLRYHTTVKPKRLTSSELDPVSGTINWPLLLQSDERSGLRGNVQKAFAERHQMGVMGYNNYIMVQQITNNLLNDMLNNIQTFSPSEYMRLKKFLEALRFEASLPLG
jgi:hypothetical protein